MKRIILWGDGQWGAYMQQNIKENWPEYEIVGVTDGFKKSIFSIEMISSLFRKGEIEGVFVSIFNLKAYLEVKNSLEKAGVPVISLYNFDDLHGDINISLEESYYIGGDAYRVDVLRDVYAVPTCYSKNECLGFFNQEGEMLAKYTIDNFEKNNPNLLNTIKPLRLATANIVELDNACCFCNRLLGSNYWHFVNQGLCRLEAMEENGYKDKYVMFASKFAREYMHLLGIPDSRVIWLPFEENNTVYKISRAYFVSFSENRDKDTSFLLRMADKIIKYLPETDGYPKYLFVKRIGTRKLYGVEKILKKHNFVTMIPDELSVEEQIKYFHSAQIIVCAHGAGSTNSLFMRTGSTFIETFGHGWIVPLSLYICSQKGIHYRMLVEEYGEPYARGSIKDYEIDECLLDLTIMESLNE